MDSLMNAVAPRSPAPAKKPSEVDFRSGAALDQLSSQVSELVLLEQGDFGDQTALEVHTAKDFIFNMLGATPVSNLQLSLIYRFRCPARPRPRLPRWLLLLTCWWQLLCNGAPVFGSENMYFSPPSQRR